MLAANKKKTNLGVGIGLVLQLAGNQLLGNDCCYVGVIYRFQELTFSVAAGLAVALVGLGVFVWGCTKYAEGKGYAPAVGFWGLLSIIGLVILVLMPDRHPEAKTVPDPGAVSRS